MDLSNPAEALAQLAAATVSIARAGTVDASLQAIADEARRCIGAHLCATHNVPEMEWRHVRVAISLSDKYAAYRDFQEAPIGAGIYSRVLKEKRALRLSPSQLTSSPGFQNYSGFAGEHPPLNGLLAAPLIGRHGATMGVVLVSDKFVGCFTDEDESILIQLAQIASSSIENALALEALQRSEARTRATYDNSSIAIGECDADGKFLDVNEGFCRLTGYTRQELLALRFFDVTHGDDAAAERQIFDRHVAGELPSYSIEKRYRRKTGSYVWVMLSASSVLNDGRFSYSVRVVQDITQRKRDEERQRLLLRELHHRVKNTLATVQAVAALTLRSSASVEEFRTAFTERLTSLSKSHSLLTEITWDGAALHDLLRLELDAYDQGGRVRLIGPEIALPAESVLVLGLAIHELTTNAAKYGALSVAAGSVEVTWSVSSDYEPILKLLWKERGGPAVKPPSKKGFGSQLLERALAVQLRGSVKMNYEADGLSVDVEAKLPAADAS